jgi:hypothetical protein
MIQLAAGLCPPSPSQMLRLCAASPTSLKLSQSAAVISICTQILAVLPAIAHCERCVTCKSAVQRALTPPLQSSYTEYTVVLEAQHPAYAQSVSVLQTVSTGVAATQFYESLAHLSWWEDGLQSCLNVLAHVRGHGCSSTRPCSSSRPAVARLQVCSAPQHRCRKQSVCCSCQRRNDCTDCSHNARSFSPLESHSSASSSKLKSQKWHVTLRRCACDT